MIKKPAVALALLASLTAPAAAQNFTQFFGFGDSSIDSGWYRNATSGDPAFDARLQAAVAAGGRGSPVGVGFMNSELLAAYFGLTANPANQPGGGTNYATSGARSGLVNNPGDGLFLGAVPVNQQITNYLAANNGVANKNALYLISAGGNDTSFAANNISNNVTPATTAYLTAQADTLAASIIRLRNAGARYFIVPNLAPGNPASPFRFGTIFSNQVWGDLAAANVNFVPADVRNLRIFIHNNLAMFGLLTDARGNTSPTTPSACRTPAGGPTSAWGLICAPTTTPSTVYATLTSPTSQLTSLYSDDQHYSAAGQKIIADYFYGLLVAPGQISYLAEAPIKTRLGVISAITNQIPLSLSQVGSFHGWVSGDVASLKLNSDANGFPDDPGTPVAITGGFDYRLSREWLIGAAFSGITTRQSFSIGGNYRQNEFAVSLYAAYRNGPWWSDAVVSFGTLHDDVNRQVPLGVSLQSNRSSTDGTNISGAIELGYNFITSLGTAPPASPLPVKAVPAGSLLLTHGPVVGIILQQVRVDGFTETNPTGAPTALLFQGQRRDSAVTELGYQASMTIGIWQPYVKAVWNHELVDTDRRNVTASLTSIAAPSFFMPAVDVGRDWGTGTIGVRAQLSRDMRAYAAFVTEVGQNGVINYGGQIGLNVALNWSSLPLVARY